MVGEEFYIEASPWNVVDDVFTNWTKYKTQSVYRSKMFVNNNTIDRKEMYTLQQWKDY